MSTSQRSNPQPNESNEIGSQGRNIPQKRHAPEDETAQTPRNRPLPLPSTASGSVNAQKTAYHVFPSAYPTTYTFVPDTAAAPAPPSGPAPYTAQRARNAVAYLFDNRHDPKSVASRLAQQPRPIEHPPPIVPPAPPGSKKILEQPGNVRISVSQNPKNPKVVRDATGVEKPGDSGYRNYTFAQRVQALTLMTHQYGAQYIEFVTGVKPKGQARLMKVAQSRGFNFIRNPRIDDAYVVDGIRTGRPKGSKTLNKPTKRNQGDDQGRQQAVHEETPLDDGEAEDEDEDELFSGSQERSVGTSESHFENITAHLASIQDHLAGTHNGKQ